jgi:hypothetical protein
MTKPQANTFHIVIRAGTLNEINDLVELNKNWFKPNLVDTNNGFLSITYDEIFFETIINNNDLLVFINNNKLIGYVLVNKVINTPHVDNIKVEYLINRPENISKNIAFSYQILVDKLYQGTGFFYSAQYEYFKFYKRKYEVLVSTVSKENTRSISAHKKAGWTFIDLKKGYFIIEKQL